MKFKIEDFIAKRKQRWNETHNVDYDQTLCDAIANQIFEDETLRFQIQEKPYRLIECCFSIVNKDKETVPFFLNEVQRDFISQLETYGTRRPYFILKGRQQGFTTVITAICLSFAIVKRNFAGFTLADRDDNTKAIFIDKAKVMYNALPDRLKPTEKFNSVNELFFDKLNSSWRIASATSNVGRSRTLSFVHFSEVAFFKCPLGDLQKSIGEAVTKNAFCIYETTANGFNEAKALWDSGSCVNLFYEWYRTDEYRSDEWEYLENPDSFLSSRLNALKEKGLSREQLCWYAKKYRSYLDKSAIKQEYPCTPEEAFLLSGDCVFDKEAISNYLAHFSVRAERGDFVYHKSAEPITVGGEAVAYQTVLSHARFLPNENGAISIVEHPKENVPYVIGADTAGTGEDYFTAKVIDNESGKCVATYRKKKIDEDLFAFQLWCLGTYYNHALIGVETNFSRHPVRVLKELCYPNLYVSKNLSTNKEKSENFYGFVTSSVTRPIILGNLISVMRENLTLETDRETLCEMASFIRHEDGKMAGATQTHDDLVMASAIARYIAIDYEHQKIKKEGANHNSDYVTW